MIFFLLEEILMMLTLPAADNQVLYNWNVIIGSLSSLNHCF